MNYKIEKVKSVKNKSMKIIKTVYLTFLYMKFYYHKNMNNNLLVKSNCVSTFILLLKIL